MDISFFGAGAVVETTTEGATLTPALPASTLAGDIAYVMVHFNANSGTPTPPTGFTEIDTSYVTAMGYGLWWKRLVGGDSDPTVTDTSGGAALSGSNGFWARTYVYRGCLSSGDPHEDATVSTGQAVVTPTTAAITTTGTSRRVVNFLAVDNNVAWNSGHPPTDWADEVADDSTGTAANHRFCVIAKVVAVPGDVASVTVGTLASGQDYRGVTLALITSVDIAGITIGNLSATSLTSGSKTATRLSDSSLATTPL